MVARKEKSYGTSLSGNASQRSAIQGTSYNRFLKFLNSKPQLFNSASI